MSTDVLVQEALSVLNSKLEMNGSKARKIDKGQGVYVDDDGYDISVVGSNSGFVYATPSSLDEAEEIARDLNRTLR